MFPKAEGSRERKLAVERQGEAKGAAPPEHNFSPPERKEAGDGLQGGLVPAAANKPDSEWGAEDARPERHLDWTGNCRAAFAKLFF